MDTRLKAFWATGLNIPKYEKKHNIHLAHGYNHAIRVANYAVDLAREVGNINLETIYAAGLLHDVYRPIKGNKGAIEDHGMFCSEVAREILTSILSLGPDEIDVICEDILCHDLSMMKNDEGKRKMEEPTLI